jgi:hypothetical protein
MRLDLVAHDDVEQSSSKPGANVNSTGARTKLRRRHSADFVLARLPRFDDLPDEERAGIDPHVVMP